jgi:hypothetical protein
MPIFAVGPARATPDKQKSMNMNTIRKITTIASMAFALTAGTAFANTNSPTTQSQGHWKSPASNSVTSHSVTIGVFSHGHGVGAKHSSPRWR